MEENQNSGKIGGIILSVIFLTWFLVSLGGLVYFSEHHEGIIAVAIAGQYFMVFGLIAIVSGIRRRKFQPITLIFPAVGIAMIAGAIIYKYGSKEVIAHTEELLPYLFLLVFFLVGLGLMIAAYLRGVRNRACTYTVQASCIHVDVRWHKGSKSFCPTYEVYFRSEMIELCNHVYTNLNHIEVGDTRELHLNPDKPTQFYEEKEEKFYIRFLYIMGALFAAVSVFAFCMVIL
ncbi:MAG: hypothetical protein J6Z35_04175 [Lachnospiraceae bacterium]|nr:hypothetical protein [Lachnospiraceae bacterium]